MRYVWVFLGGALGSVLRYWCYSWVPRVTSETFPWGTMFVNVVGCTFIGWFAAWAGPDGRALVSPGVRVFVMTGICGGFTTFSTFSLETLSLARDGEWFRAAGNVVASVLFCLAGVWAGHALATTLNE